MEREEKDVEHSLLDWHLDQLDADDRSWIEEALRRDVEFRAKSNRLGTILQPLDHWRVTPAPDNLADNVVAHVQRSIDARSEPQPFPFESGRPRRFPFARLRQPIAVAACILLLIGVLVPGVSELRSRSQRALCAGNLGSIFRGTTTYQAAFAGSLPFAGYSPGASWLPSGARGRPYASNSRHIYLLVKWGCGPTTEDFVCPAAKPHEPMRVADPTTCDDFAGACNVSYASLNLAGTKPNLMPTTRIAYISDANPLFVGARFNASVPYNANSPAHRGRGQNVLTLDGSSRWMKKPIYGPKHDNLWLIGNIRRYIGIEAPVSDDDVQLVPGYPVTDPAVSRTLQRY